MRAEPPRGVVFALAIVVAIVGCRRGSDAPREAPRAPDLGVDAAPAASAALLPDGAVGPLIDRLSENPGRFPSDNYVSNETTLLDVAPALRDRALRGRAYVGVGPEQNYTYLGLSEPSVAYIVDIRRDNLLEHMVLRGCFEEGTARAGFLRALLARRPRSAPDASIAGFSALEAAFRDLAFDPSLRDAAAARTKRLLDRLGVRRTDEDDVSIARIHGAFAELGLAIAYTMENGRRDYPSLAQLLSATDPSGAAATFLASEEVYARVRRLVVENRVLPIVGDFGGTHALRAVGDDMRARGVSLGVFYASNVEQYLFEPHTHPKFVASLGTMPHDGASRIVRVWFDHRRPHPRQRPGHRTTQLVEPVDAFLDRASVRPFTSYWDCCQED